MLRPVRIPGLFVTATDTEVGKTVIAGAIANYFLRRGGQGGQGANVGVLKPVATGCVARREGLVSEDAEFLASCADARFPLDLICPQRYREPLAPAVAADRAQQPLDWNAVQLSIDLITGAPVQMARRERAPEIPGAQEPGPGGPALRPTTPPADVLIVEGVGGILVPLDRTHTTLDLARWLSLPTVVVARPGLGTINHTLLTLDALRRAGVPVAGVVINRYPAESASVAEETAPRYIEKFGKVPILAVVPHEPGLKHPPLPPSITSPIDMVDWQAIAKRER
jgi:dethiobiotin synthetase